MQIVRSVVQRVEQHAVEFGWSLAAAMSAREPASGAIAAAPSDGGLVFTGVDIYAAWNPPDR